VGWGPTSPSTRGPRASRDSRRLRQLIADRGGVEQSLARPGGLNDRIHDSRAGLHEFALAARRLATGNGGWCGIEVVALIHRAVQHAMDHVAGLWRRLAVAGQWMASQVAARIAVVRGNELDPPAGADDLARGVCRGLGLAAAEDQPAHQPVHSAADDFAGDPVAVVLFGTLHAPDVVDEVVLRYPINARTGRLELAHVLRRQEVRPHESHPPPGAALVQRARHTGDRVVVPADAVRSQDLEARLGLVYVELRLLAATEDDGRE